MTEYLKALEDLTEQQKRLDELYTKSGKKVVKDALEGFFEQFPEVKTVCWSQWAPNFNDGDPCVFHIQGEIIFSGLEWKDIGTPSYFYPGTEEGETVDPLTENKNPEREKVADQIAGMLCSNETLLERAFGTDANVYVTKGKVHVEEYYDHD